MFGQVFFTGFVDLADSILRPAIAGAALTIPSLVLMSAPVGTVTVAMNLNPAVTPYPEAPEAG